MAVLYHDRCGGFRYMVVVCHNRLSGFRYMVVLSLCGQCFINQFSLLEQHFGYMYKAKDLTETQIFRGNKRKFD